MSKRYGSKSHRIIHQAADLIHASSNRYRITVQVANRAQRRRYEDFDSLEDSNIKPVLQAIVEMSEELYEPEVIAE